MIRYVTQIAWDEVAQDFRQVPLDDADKWTIELARQVNGRDLTDREVENILRKIHIAG